MKKKTICLLLSVVMIFSHGLTAYAYSDNQLLEIDNQINAIQEEVSASNLDVVDLYVLLYSGETDIKKTENDITTIQNEILQLEFEINNLETENNNRYNLVDTYFNFEQKNDSNNLTYNITDLEQHLKIQRESLQDLQVQLQNLQVQLEGQRLHVENVEMELQHHLDELNNTSDNYNNELLIIRSQANEICQVIELYGVQYECTGSEIVMYAEQFVGNPYVWGGNSLTNGIDCSHFVYQVLKNCNVYNGEYVTSAGWRSKGEHVESLSEARAGDVLCYDGHVAIYDGYGGIVEAKSSRWGITHDRSATYGKILAIRRFI